MCSRFSEFDSNLARSGFPALAETCSPLPSPPPPGYLRSGWAVSHFVEHLYPPESLIVPFFSPEELARSLTSASESASGEFVVVRRGYTITSR